MILHSLNTSSEYSACWPKGCARFAVGVTQTSQWSLDSTKYLGHKFSFDMLPLSIDIFNCVLLLLFDDVLQNNLKI